jgi:hypothetical protein
MIFPLKCKVFSSLLKKDEIQLESSNILDKFVNYQLKTLKILQMKKIHVFSMIRTNS